MYLLCKPECINLARYIKTECKMLISPLLQGDEYTAWGGMSLCAKSADGSTSVARGGCARL
jgi:hypothetical protein